jgi:hypothetical protein
MVELAEHELKRCVGVPSPRRFSKASRQILERNALLRAASTKLPTYVRSLARRKSGVQIPSPPPPTQQVRASPASSRRRSLHAPAAPRPHAQVAVQPKRLAATR